MKIEKLKNAANTLNGKLTEAMRGQNLAATNLAKAQIEFNNEALAAITNLQQQAEKLAQALKDPQATRLS